MKIGVIGQGYVGLSVAMAASEKHEVIGYDLNKKLISNLQNGRNSTETINAETLKKRLETRRYFPTDNPADLAEVDIVVIAVPTPLDEERKPDLKYIESACLTIAKYVTKPTLIINESTSYPGTIREIIKPFVENNSLNKIEHLYAVSPERVDPGNYNWTQKNTPRLVAGLTSEATEKASAFYQSFCDKIVKLQSPEIAETAKLFENTFRQVNIALVNELAIICNALQINVHDVINAAATKPYGFMKFNPGPGVGGHCIPVDPTYLAFKANQAGIKARFIDLSNEVNLDMPKYVIKRSEALLGNLKNKKLVIVGVTYKSDIADVRETPAELIRNLAITKGAMVEWYDPLVANWESGKVNSLEKVKYDLAIVQTLHNTINQNEVKESAHIVLDCTGRLNNVESI